MDLVMYAEKRRRSGRWQLIDPPNDYDYLGGWDLGRWGGVFQVLHSLKAREGRPIDLSPELSERFLGDDRKTNLWLPLPDLLSVNLDQGVTQRSFVDLESYRQFKATGRPGMSFNIGAGFRTVTNEEMDRLLHEKTVIAPPPMTQIEWSLPLREASPGLAALLETLRCEGDPANVRLLYGWF